MTRAWFIPKSLPNAMRPRVPGHTKEDDDAVDDEEGIMQTVNIIDDLIQQELDRGVLPDRIIVGGFSQGCAASLVWGLTGHNRDHVRGVICLSGYFPLTERIESLRGPRNAQVTDAPRSAKKWFYVHGTRDVLVSSSYFRSGQEHLRRWVAEEDIEIHLYEGMGHSTNNAELRDMLRWLEQLIPP